VLSVGGVNRPIHVQNDELVVRGPEDTYVSGWSRDGTAYYWGSIKLQDADYNSLEILNDLHAKDDASVYFRGKEIRGADAETFVIVGPGSVRGRDKNSEYELGKRTGRLKNKN